MQNNNLSIPIAIVIAGGLVAFSIYAVSPKGIPTNNNSANVTNALEYSINMPVVNDNDHIRGNPGAPIKIVEYSDTECPYCKQFHTTMKSIVDTYGKDGTVAWVYRQFPIKSLHPKAIIEAEATECVAKLAGEEAFWTYLDSIYSTTASNNKLPEESLYTLAQAVGVNRNDLKSCLDNGEFTEKVANAVNEAQKAGARGTPYSVIELSEALSDEKIVALRTFNDQLTGGAEMLIRVDEITKDKVAVNGALPKEILDGILSILKS